MKKILFLCIVLLLGNRIDAQILPNTSFIISGQNYNVTIDGIIYRPNYDINYPTYPEASFLCKKELGNKKVDYINIYNLITQKFSVSRCATLTRTLRIWIGVIPTTGIVLDVVFLAGEDIMLTPQEVYDLDIAIRQMTFSPSQNCTGIGREVIEFTIYFDTAHLPYDYGDKD